MKYFKKRRSFKKEFKHQLRTAILAAIGFTIAFAWKEVVFDNFESYISSILDVRPEHFLTQTYTALVITAVGVLFIFLTSRLLRD